MKTVKWSALIILSLLTASGCENSDDAFSFNYNTILNREFRNSTGRIIPLAYEQAVETNGDISSDGRYFYYTSNRANGNYDIYLRDLNDIATARLTDHAAKDTEPAVSPDGKKLVFVSTREDPEGDIYLLKISPEKLIQNEKSSVGGGTAADGKAVNLTQIKNEDGSVKSVKDSSPVWSPDGKRIAFTSRRDGWENIWIMDSSGKNLSRVTEEGGIYPAFSADGESLVFISYRRENSSGDVYVQKKGRKPELIIGGKGIKLFPGFLASQNEILYSLIDRDTNGDGTVDLRDDSVIMYYNLSTKESWPLTLPSSSCFNGKWLTNSWSRNHDGLLLFSDIQGENINVNIIPGYGIIPKKTKAVYQYQLAVSYNEEYNDEERYVLGLKRVRHFFGNKKDNESLIYTARALNLLHKYYTGKGNRQQADEVLSWLEQLAVKGNLYVKAQYEKISAGGKSAPADIVRKNISLAEKDKNAETVLPYLKEDLAGLLIEKGDDRAALSVLAEIKDKFPKYEEISSVHMEYALLAEKKVSPVLSDSALYTLENGRNVQKIRMNRCLTDLYLKEKNISFKLSCLDSLMKNCGDKKRVSALLCYIKALVYAEQNKKKEAFGLLKKASELTGVNDLIHYMAGIKSASMQERNSAEWEKDMAEAVTSYKRVFADAAYREKVSGLVDYYESEGKKLSAAGDFSGAAEIYGKYRTLIRYIFSYRYFPEMYSIFGPRAHVLYADASVSGKGAGAVKSLEEEYLKDLFRARIESDKAYIYGLAYIDLLKALSDENSTENLFRGLADSMKNIDWALFIDDSFVDPYVLKSWIYQYCDVKRAENSSVDRICSRYFPDQLWEANIPLLERALEANEEDLYPEHEGDIHLNLANSYFLLVNYPRAMNHYALAEKYKKSFDSETSHALFCFHYAYCCWQNGETEKARELISAADYIYRSISSEKNIRNYAGQFYIIYRYYALFDRLEGNWKQAIEDYRRILSFTAAYGLETDRARYYQEIAWCYQELNMLDEAADALASADRLLEKYPDDEQTYKLTFGFRGIPVLKIWDLGPDTAVIGKNKIFTQLDTRNKKLLNLSMLEKIQVRRSDYEGALEFLQKKTDFLKGRKNSVDVESLIITYNNSGVYSVLADRNDEAEEWFGKAWDLAVKEGYPEGSFSAAMNLSSLYAFELENSSVRADSGKRIGSLIEKISGYRENYENDAYAAGLKSLKADAKKQDRQATDEELEELKSSVKMQSAEACFRIDIALGVLYFYQAEIKRQELCSGGEEAAAEEIYSEHRALYDMYASALEKFQAALNSSGDGDRPLKIKLLLNAGTCMSRMGAVSDAYSSFLEAAEEADDSGSGMLIFRSQAALGHFLNQYRVPGSSRSDAAEHFEKALTCLKEVPVMYMSVQENAGNVFSALTELYLEKGAWAEAFRTDEEKTAFRRAMLYHFSVSSMPSERHRELYDRYSDLSAELISRYGDLEKGKGSAAAVKEASASLKSFVSSACREDSVFCSCMTAECPSLSSVKGTVVRFYLLEETLHIWILSAGKLSHSSVPADDYAGLERILSGRGEMFIICSPSLYNLMHRKPDVLKNIRASLVTSLVQAEAFEKMKSGSVSSMYSVSVLKNAPELPVYTEGKEKDPAGYDIIADSLKEPVFTSDSLFSKKLDCEILVTSGDGFLDIYRKAEALSCAGTVCGLITENTDADAGKLTAELLKKGSDEIMASEKNLFCFGKYFSGRKADSAGVYRSFREALSRKDYAEAEILLLRWHKSAGSDSEIMKRFLNDMVSMNLFQGKFSEAENAVSEAENISGEERNIYRAWICLAEGKIPEAADLLAQESSVPDYPFLKEILNAAEGKNVSAGSFEGINSGTGKGRCISGEQLCLLYAEYLHLAGKPGGKELMERTGDMTGAGFTEAALAVSLKCSRNAEKLQADIRELSDIGEKYRSGQTGVSGILEKINDADLSRSAAGVLLLSADDSMCREILLSDSMDRLRTDSFWMDRLMMDLKLAEYSMNRDSGKALEILKTADSSPVPPCFRKKILAAETSCLLSMNRYEDAYKTALEAEKLLNPDDDDFRSVQLFLIDTETGSTTPEAAGPRIDVLLKEKDLTASERIALNLYLTRIELKKLSGKKQSTVQDGKVFSRLYSETVSLADRNPFSFLRGIRTLFCETAEAYITYLWETGDTSAAFSHAEIKQRILAKGDFGLKGRILPVVDIKEAGKNLGGKEIIICPVKAGNSLLTWVIGPDRIMAGKTEGGYAAAEKYLEECFKEEEPDLSAAGKNFSSLFGDALALTDRAETVYIMPDEFTEKIPFEAFVQADGKLLCRKKKLCFITSPAKVKHSGICSAVLPFGSDPDSLFSGAESAALSESGCSMAEKSSGAFVHIYGKTAAGKNGLPEISGKSILPAVAGSTGVFVSETDFSQTEFSLYCREAGSLNCLINGALKRDLNLAFFMDTFYRSLASGSSISSSFHKARISLADGEYRNPAFWCYIRLYMNGLCSE